MKKHADSGTREPQTCLRGIPGGGDTGGEGSGEGVLSDSSENGSVACHFLNLLLESLKIKKEDKKQKCKVHFQQN